MANKQTTFIRYLPEFIQSLRPQKDEIISEKLSKHFDWINELFLASTQYQENRKKINYNQINSQKWRTNNLNIVNSILLMLNGLDNTLYNEIEQKILNIEIKDINNMRKIIEILHEKTCESFNAPSVLNLYINLLHKIISNGIWYYKIGDKITDYICPRIVAVSIAQKNYLEMLDTFLSIIDNFNKTNDDVSYFKVKNQKFIGNMLYIGKLYNKRIISTELINIICDNIINKVESDIKNVDLIEYLLHMLEILEEYPNIDNVISQLNELSDKLSSRIKYLVLNFVESYNKKDMKEDIINNNLLTKNKILEQNLVDSYNNLVIEYIINESIDDFMNALKNKVEGELILAILRKYNPKCETKLLELISKLIEKKVLNRIIINEKIKLYNENGTLEDIAEECPIIYKFTEKLKNEIN
jgi:hypothetical protein